MPNMSYCRFENTLSDLRDCHDNIEDEPVNFFEKRARVELIKLCVRIADDYGHEVEKEESK